jgi:DNA-binding NtrC family response regulator
LEDAQLASLLFPDSAGGGPTAIARAAGGTLFLESIGELSMRSQAGLMRILDEAAGPVSAPPRCALDSRIICSTERVLRHAVLAGTFREDLYYRLNTVYLEVPSLTGEEWESCSMALVA